MHAQWGSVGFNIQKVLSDMEIWRGRVKSAPSYDRQMNLLEQAWKVRKRNGKGNVRVKRLLTFLLPFLLLAPALPSLSLSFFPLSDLKKEQNKEKNEAAVKAMRALLPVDISGLSIDEIQARARERGAFYPREFAFY